MGTGDKGPRGDRGNGRGGRDRDGARERRPRERDRADDRANREPRPDPLMPGQRRSSAHHARLGRAGRHRGDALGALDRARVLGARGLARRGDRAGRHLALPGAPALQGHGSLQLARDRRAVRRDGGGGQRRHRQGDHLRLLALPRPPPRAAFDVLQDMVLRPAYPDIDSERQVVIEEIAMYEDEPSDKVHDVLAGAIFGDHPLGRPIIGRAEVISSVPVPRDRRLARRALHAGANIVVAAAGNLEHERIVELVEGAVPARRVRPRRRSRARPTAPRRRCASTRRRPSSTTSAWAARASPAATSGASRCGSSTRSWAARPPRGCSRRCARSAGWPTRSTPTRATTSTRARWRSTSARAPTTWRRRWT